MIKPKKQSPIENKAMEDDLIRQLYATVGPSLLASFFLASVLVVYQWGRFSPYHSLGWFTFIVSVLTARWIVSQRFNHVQEQTQLSRWRTVYRVLILTTGLAWGSSTSFLYMNDDPAFEMVIVLLIAGITAGPIGSLSRIFNCYLIFVVSALTPLLFYFIISENENSGVMAGLTACYAIFLLGLGRTMYGSNLNSLKLSFENKNLIQHLKQEQEKTNRLNQNLQIEIDERKRAELDLRANKSRLYRSHEFAKIGNWDWDLDMDEVFWSEYVSVLFGDDKHEQITSFETFVKRVHPDDRERFVQKLDDCLKKGEQYELQHRVIWPDGSLHWIQQKGNVLRKLDDEPSHVLCVAQDITVQKEAEQALSLSRSRLEHLVSLSPVVIYTCHVMDAVQVTFVSDNIFDLTGFAPEDFLGDSKFWLDHIHLDDNEKISNDLKIVLDKGAHSYEYRFKRADGSYVWIHDEIRVI
ncbi:MAG: PAS domain-containing protein, partial [Gammaproteobacteria bacterium]|nr:PAS domain-containing protein [Gammaproteobacteria bacterium]